MIHLAKYHLLVVPAMGSSSIQASRFRLDRAPLGSSSGRTIALVAIASLWGQRHRSASELSQKKTSGLPLCTVLCDTDVCSAKKPTEKDPDKHSAKHPCQLQCVQNTVKDTDVRI